MNDTPSDNRSEDRRIVRKPSFRIRSLLLVVFIVALLLSAYEYGRKSGYQAGTLDGFRQGEAAAFDKNMHVRVYKVSDLVLPSPGATSKAAFADFQALMTGIQQNVVPLSWESKGGMATMAPYPQNLSLIVSTNQYGHDKLVAYIRALRASSGEKPMK